MNIDNNEDKMIEQRLKVIIAGAAGSGKGEVAKGADICVPFKSLGVSLGKKTNLNEKINYKLILFFWTLTKGRPRDTTYLAGSSAAIIVGNLNKTKSISKMSFWAEKIHGFVGEIPLFFIGTIDGSRPIRRINRMKKLAKSYNASYFLLPLTDENRMELIFQSIANRLAKKYFKKLQKKYVSV